MSALANLIRIKEENREINGELFKVETLERKTPLANIKKQIELYKKRISELEKEMEGGVK
jgi:hypothetical protein